MPPCPMLRGMSRESFGAACWTPQQTSRKGAGTVEYKACRGQRRCPRGAPPAETPPPEARPAARPPAAALPAAALPVDAEFLDRGHLVLAAVLASPGRPRRRLTGPGPKVGAPGCVGPHYGYGRAAWARRHRAARDKNGRRGQSSRGGGHDPCGPTVLRGTAAARARCQGAPPGRAARGALPGSGARARRQSHHGAQGRTAGPASLRAVGRPPLRTPGPTEAGAEKGRTPGE